MNLRAHQLLAADLADKTPFRAIFDEPGCGKTATTVEILRREFNRQKRLLRTLIFAPLSVCPQWKLEFENFAPKIPQDRILVLTGPGKKRVDLFARAAICGQPFIAITNYEAVQIKEFYAALLRWKPEIAVADEMHMLKDAGGKRAKKIYPLTDGCSKRIGLTGTPVPNGLIDIFGQFKFLDPAIFGPGFWSFRTRFFYDRNSGKKFAYPDWVPHPSAAKDIAYAISKCSTQAKRKDCLDLPERQVIQVNVDMGAGQRKAYNQMKRDFMTEVKGEVMSADFAMVKTLRMQQIIAGYIQPDNAEKPVFFEDQPRLDALMDIVRSVGKEKIIIWTNFQPTYDQIARALQKEGYNIAFLTGEQTTPQKGHSIETFCRGETQILISNPAAGGTGLNLQEAKVSIYYSRGYNSVHFEQSQDRNYRSGSEMHDKILQYQLITRDSVDEVIGHALMAKKSVGEAVLMWAKKNLDTVKSKAESAAEANT